MSVAKFSLYRHDGLKLWFEVDAPSAAVVSATVDDYLASGYAITAGGLEQGEEVEQITGFVYGSRSDGQPLVWLYASPLEFRVLTVWEERVGELPIDLTGVKQWAAGSAPKAAEAAAKGYLVPAQFEVVKAETGRTTQSGRPVYEFGRVRSGIKPAPAATGDALSFDGESLTEEPITSAQLRALHTVGRKAYDREWGEEGRRRIRSLTSDRTESSRELTKSEASDLIELLSAELLGV